MKYRHVRTGLRTAVLLAGVVVVLGGCGAGSTGTTASRQGSADSVTVGVSESTVVGSATTATAAARSGGGASGVTTAGSTSVPGHPTTTRPTSGVTATTARPAVTTTLPTGSSASGVQGTVSAGPTCPVQRVDMPCPPQPVVAEVDARDGAGTVVARTRSDAGGHYDLVLTPGSYGISVMTSGPYPRCPVVPVSVRSGQEATADIGCDTGIR